MQPVSRECGAEQTRKDNLPSRANTTQQTKRKRLLEACAAQQQDDDNEEMSHIADILEQVKSQAIPNSIEGLLVIAKTIRRTLIEINEQKERHRERRHQELMQLIGKCLRDDKVYVGVQKSGDAAAKSEEEPEYVEALEDIIQVTDGDDGSTSNVVEERPTLQIVERVAAAQRKTLPQTTDRACTFTDIVRQKHQNEFQAMRERMLEIQRQKMEDRERKKQIAMQLERQKKEKQQKPK